MSTLRGRGHQRHEIEALDLAGDRLGDQPVARGVGVALAAKPDLVLLALPGREGRLEIEVAQARCTRGALDHGRDLGMEAVVVAREVLRVGQEHYEHRYPVSA